MQETSHYGLRQQDKQRCNATGYLWISNCSCKHHWGHYPQEEGTLLRLTTHTSSLQDFQLGSHNISQKSSPRAKDHMKWAPERPGSSQYSCHRDNTDNAFHHHGLHAHWKIITPITLLKKRHVEARLTFASQHFGKPVDQVFSGFFIEKGWMEMDTHKACLCSLQDASHGWTFPAGQPPKTYCKGDFQ